MRADGCQGEHPGIRAHDRAAGGEGVGRGTGGGADDEAVAAVTGEGVAIDAHGQFDEAGRGAAADDEIVEGGFGNGDVSGATLGLDEGARLEDRFAGQDLAERQGKLMSLDVGEESEGAGVDANDGSAGAGGFAGDTEQGAVASKDHEQIHLACECGGVDNGHSGQAGDAGGRRVGEHRASGGADQRGGFSDEMAAGRFVGVGDQADAPDGFSDLFQAEPEIPCCPRGRGEGSRSRCAIGSRRGRRRTSGVPRSPGHGPPDR